MKPNVVWHEHRVSKKDRKELNKHKPCLIWFTGLSASGKSTIAGELEYQLHQRGVHTYLLDGDNVRHGLNKNLGFSPEDRAENIRRIGEVGKLFVDSGAIVMTAFISPYRTDRDSARALLEPGEFIEVFVKCPLDVCETRDPKGMYKKAREGIIKQFTGIDAPYEEPAKAEITVETDKKSIEESVAFILEELSRLGIFN